MHRLGVALVGFAALGAVACAGILGIQDRALDSEDGGGSSSGGGDDGSGGGCTDPCTMATGLDHPFMMTADEANVYWTEFGDDEYAGNGSVKSCPAAGCGAGPLVYAVLQSAPRGIAVDAQNVYWATATSQDQNGAIWSCAIAGCGGKPTKVVDANVPYGIALDGTYVYWVDNYDDTVNRAPKAGGSMRVLWDAGSGAVNNGQECVVDGTFAYVTDQDFNLYRVPVGGGDIVQMYTQAGGWFGPAPVAVDPSGVYLGTPGQILRFDKNAADAGGTAVESTVAGPSGLTIDPATSTLYWSDWGSGTGKDGTVGQVPLDGGGPTVLAQAVTTAEAVAVNGTYVFWLSNGTPASSGGATTGTGALYRTKKR